MTAAGVIIAFAILGAVFVLVTVGQLHDEASFLQFYAAGKDAGFTLRQIRLLHRVARETNFANPSSLFWSKRSLDRCITAVYRGFYRDGLEDEPRNAAFLDQLFSYRKMIELNQPRVRFGIQSTRNLDVGQSLKIMVDGGGSFRSRIVENTRTHLAVSYPSSPAPPRGLTWRGKMIRVVLYRRDDAAYTFASRVNSDYLRRKPPILQVAHVELMEREQKRDSVRAPLTVPGRITPVQAPEDVDPLPTDTGGFRCRMVDISEDGAALIVGGRVKAGVHLRIETRIDGHPVIIAGTVCSAAYNEKKHFTVLHIAGEVTDLVTKNRVRAYVFGFDRAQTQQRPDRLSATVRCEHSSAEPAPKQAPEESVAEEPVSEEPSRVAMSRGDAETVA